MDGNDSTATDHGHFFGQTGLLAHKEAAWLLECFNWPPESLKPRSSATWILRHVSHGVAYLDRSRRLTPTAPLLCVLISRVETFARSTSWNKLRGPSIRFEQVF